MKKNDKNQIKQKIAQVRRSQQLSFEELLEILHFFEDAFTTGDLNPERQEVLEYLSAQARAVAQENFGNRIYIRGLIEFSNYCKNDCYYCGIRCSNQKVSRYRLDKEQVLICCKTGYDLGYRTFVLQSGEDGFFTDEVLIDWVQTIKKEYPDCVVTLSVGERTKESYKALREAGADRYLLRHETANEAHYRILHPDKLSLVNRKECLMNLKELGYQIGCGMMIGAPGQTLEHLAEDFCYMQSLKPHMIGVGPFIPHADTPFAEEKRGTVAGTLIVIALCRLLFPHALIPSTTALSTLDEEGRQKGILAGANVVMPNLSPDDVKEKYMLYNQKKATGTEAAEALEEFQKQLLEIGYEIAISRGDYSD